ncbi:hypothetical protein C8R47DRAFT_1228802 [Mycena vitilis]|nr:hypothetical protein C8R47DRAFT_1228802 [Mycena vitilis]
MPPGLAKAFEPVEGGVGVGGGEEGEEVEDVVDVEVAVGAKRKGKRRASNEPAGNSAKRRPHRETSMPSIVIMQEQGTDAADGGERGAQTSPVEPPPSYSGHAAVDSSPPPDSMRVRSLPSPVPHLRACARRPLPRCRAPSAYSVLRTSCFVLLTFLAAPSRPSPISRSPLIASSIVTPSSLLRKILPARSQAGGVVPPSADADGYWFVGVLVLRGSFVGLLFRIPAYS